MNLSVNIRTAEIDDAAAISQLVRKALKESNSKDYPASVIDRLSNGVGVEDIETFIQTRMMFVAEQGARVVGTASLDNNVVRTVFIEPDKQRRSVGRQLMSKIEEAAREAACATLLVPSSITAVSFYEKLGYRHVRDEFFGEEKTIIMERVLTA